MYRNAPLLKKLESKHRTTGLDENDCALLKEFIVKAQEVSELASALEMYGYWCKFDSTVAHVCKRHIQKTPSPGLTATCLRLVCYYWGMWQLYQGDLIRYLDANIYDDWYNEIVFSIRYCSELRASGETDIFNSKLDVLKSRSQELGIDEELFVR